MHPDDAKTVCFMHIGKVGGHAVCQELFNRFDLTDIYNGSPEQFDAMDKQELAEKRLIVGHFSHEHLAKLPSPRYLFSMVREPLDRTLSNYWFLKTVEVPDASSPRRRLIELAHELDLDAFLDCDDPEVALVTQNHQTHFFAGDWRAARVPGNDLLKRAYSHLEDFDFIGIYERYDESLQTMCVELGWRPWPSQIRLNVTAHRQGLDDISGSTRDRLEALNELDIELYAHLRARFEATYHRSLKALVAARHATNHAADRKVRPPHVELRADQAIAGDGWQMRELIDGTYARWLGPDTQSTIELDVDSSKPLSIQLEFVRWLDHEVLDGITLAAIGADGTPIEVERRGIEKTSSNATLSWHLPAIRPADGSPLTLRLQAPKTGNLEAHGFADSFERRGSAAVSAIKVTPAGGDDSAVGENSLEAGISLLQQANGRLSKIVAAERIFRDACQHEPADPNAHFWLAEALCYQGRAPDAVPSLERAIELAESSSTEPLQADLNTRLHERMGEALTLSGIRLDEAREHFRKAVELNPGAADSLRLNSAGYMLAGLDALQETQGRRNLARWPVNLDRLDTLDKIVAQATAKRGEPDKIVGLETQLVALGSCFAKNLGMALQEMGVSTTILGLGELINSTYANRALLEWITKAPESCCEPSAIDTLKVYFGNSAENVASIFRKADVVIFTLGVAPSFFDRETGLFHLTQPLVNTLHLLNTKEFRTTSVAENTENIEFIIAALRQLNPAIEIVFTVSPVPLYATFEYDSAIVADCVSKSTLRVAIDAVMKNGVSKVHYWPAFEIVRWMGAYWGPMYGAEDNTSRHVSEAAVNAIVDAFVRSHADDALNARAQNRGKHQDAPID